MKKFKYFWPKPLLSKEKIGSNEDNLKKMKQNLLKCVQIFKEKRTLLKLQTFKYNARHIIYKQFQANKDHLSQEIQNLKLQEEDIIKYIKQF